MTYSTTRFSFSLSLSPSLLLSFSVHLSVSNVPVCFSRRVEGLGFRV